MIAGAFLIFLGTYLGCGFLFAVPFVLSEGRVVPGNVLTGEEPYYVGSTPAGAGGLFGDARDLPEGYTENGGRGWLGCSWRL